MYDDGMERQIRVKNKTYTIKLNAASVKAERAVFIENAVKGAVELAQSCAERLSGGGVDAEFAAVFGESGAVAKRRVCDVFRAVPEVFEGVGFLLKKVFVDKNGRSPEVLASADAATNTISLYDAFFAEDSDPENDRPSVLLHEAAHLCGLKSDAESGSPDSAECVRNFALLVSGKMDIDELLGKGESDEADVDEADGEEDGSSDADDADGADESGVADGDGGESECGEDEQENGDESERGGEEMPYRPDQLRAPKGQSNGGQWVSEGGGAGGAESSGNASISQQSHKTQTTNAPEKQPDTASTESLEEKENKDEKPTNSKKTKEEEEKEKKTKKQRKAFTVPETKDLINKALSLLDELAGSKNRFNTPEARELLLGTAIQETDLIPRPQDKSGIANGLMQIEERTFNSLVKKYIPKKYPEIWEKLKKYFAPKDGIIRYSLVSQNHLFSIILARFKYCYGNDIPLPKCGDIKAQAKYWFKWYNGSKDKSKIKQFIEKWKKYNK